MTSAFVYSSNTSSPPAGCRLRAGTIAYRRVSLLCRCCAAITSGRGVCASRTGTRFWPGPARRAIVLTVVGAETHAEGNLLDRPWSLGSGAARPESHEHAAEGVELRRPCWGRASTTAASSSGTRRGEQLSCIDTVDWPGREQPVAGAPVGGCTVRAHAGRDGMRTGLRAALDLHDVVCATPRDVVSTEWNASWNGADLREVAVGAPAIATAPRQLVCVHDDSCSPRASALPRHRGYKGPPRCWRVSTSKAAGLLRPPPHSRFPRRAARLATPRPAAALYAGSPRHEHSPWLVRGLPRRSRGLSA